MRKYRGTSESLSTVNPENDDETTLVDLNNPNLEAYLQSIAPPPPSEPTPLFQTGLQGNIAATYLVELQRYEERSRPGRPNSATIDARATRIVVCLAHGKLLDRAKQQYIYLSRGTATDDAIYIIDQAIEAGIRYQDINPTLDEPRYQRMKADHTLQTLRRLWIQLKTSEQPNLAHIIQIEEALQKGVITLAEIHSNSNAYQHVKQRAHACFAEQVIEAMRNGGSSRSLLILLKIAIEQFGVDPNSLSLSSDEYRTLLKCHQLAS